MFSGYVPNMPPAEAAAGAINIADVAQSATRERGRRKVTGSLSAVWGTPLPDCRATPKANRVPETGRRSQTPSGKRENPSPPPEVGFRSALRIPQAWGSRQPRRGAGPRPEGRRSAASVKDKPGRPPAV